MKDKDIREPLFDYLEAKYGKVRIFEEKNMGESRADIVMVCEDMVIGIEIKSDADTYTRLAGQVKDYDKYFDKNIVVVGGSHAKHVAEHVPDYWGIVSVEDVEGTADLYEVREPSSNPKCELRNKIRFLWRPELAHIQELKGFPKYAQKSKDFVREYLMEKLTKEELDHLISEELFERDYTTIGDKILEYRKARNPKKRVRKKRVRHRRKV